MIFLATMPTLTTNQKIAIALSVPVAGVLFYFLLKWAREDDELEDEATDSADEFFLEFVSTSDLVSELQIPQCHVGAVIGNIVRTLILNYNMYKTQKKVSFSPSLSHLSSQ